MAQNNMAQIAGLRSRSKPPFEPQKFLAKTGLGRTVMVFRKGQIVFSQGDTADKVFYIQKGRIKLTVISKRGKEATIALLGSGDFLGGMHSGDAARAHGHCHGPHARHPAED